MRKRHMLFLAVWLMSAVGTMAQLNLKLTVHVEEPGTLFLKIQEQIEEVGELSDVTELTVTGQMDSYDSNVIRNQMKNLQMLDLSGVNGECGKYVSVGYLKRLKRVVLPTEATELGDNTLCYCDSLTTIVMPSVLKSIPSGFVNNSKRLPSIDIPATVTTIGYSAFTACWALTSIVLPDSVTTLGERVFWDCRNLTDVQLPDGITNFPVRMFRDCPKLKQLKLPKNLATIQDEAFYNTGIETFTLPEGVKITGSEAFANCNELRSFTFPDGLKDVTEVGSGTFYGCDSLKQVRLPADLTEIPYHFFAETGLESLDWPASVTKINSEAFLRFDGMKHFTVPTTVKEMGSAVFSGSKIEVMDWPASVHIIPNSTFWDARQLKEINIPETVDSIGENCFLRCYELRKVQLPEGIRTLNKTFNSCNYLTQVNIPSTVTYIGSGAFDGCLFRHIDIPDGVTYIGSSAFVNVPLEEIKLPSKLRYIGENAFSASWRRQSKYSRVVVPEGVYYIGKTAFDSDSLRYIDLPSTLINLGYSLMNNRHAVDSVVIRAIVPPLTNGNVFGNNETGSKLFVPTQSQLLYQYNNSYNMVSSIEPIGVSAESVLNVMYPIYMRGNDWADKKYDIHIITTYGTDYPIRTEYHPYVIVSKGAQVTAGTISMKHDLDQQLSNTDYKFETFLNQGTLTADQIDLSCRMMGSHFFTPSFATRMSDIIPEVPNTPYAVYSYDGGARAAGNFANAWVRIGNEETLQPGQGYAFTGEQVYEYHPVYKRYVGYWKFLHFRSHQGGANCFTDNSDVTVPLHHYNGEFDHNKNWNFVGMPYPTFFDIRGLDYDGPVLVWQSNGSKWMALSALDDEYVIDPMHALFVQAPEGVNSLTFSAERRQVGKAFVKGETTNSRQTLRRADQNQHRTVFNLALSTEAAETIEPIAATRFVINPDATLRYDIGRDAPVMSSDSTALLYTQAGGVAYAINERPLADGLIRLGMQLVKPGTYRLGLSLKTGTLLSDAVAENIWLIDNDEHTRTLLLHADGTPAEPYTFAVSEPATLSSRFIIAIGNAEPSAITDVEEAKPLSTSALYNLGGMRISQPQQGIYIQDGKKIIKK